MPIHILDSADPLSDASLSAGSDAVLRNAQSGAGRVLRLELARYCRGEVNGRSFLIAGHRGAGKTTMVADALDQVLKRSRLPVERLLRPLPIFLHGPSLFETEAHDSEPAREGTARRRNKDEPSEQQKMAAQARVALKHIILGIHRAVVTEFARGYRQSLVEGDANAARLASQRTALAELAAQFEIELAEDPPARRLHEFWEMAGALQSGVLFAASPRPGQGSRELVALNGMCNAHQRISGEMSALDKTARSDDETVEKTVGTELRGAELVKPLASVLAGAVVAAGSAAGSHGLGLSLAAGLAAALVSSLFVKSTTTTIHKQGRQTDTSFIPDLSLKTLDRILPTLIQRLRDAGLAPVLVIDELDKVRGLPDRLVGMIHFLKKLLAENVFTCFLTDRGYLEHLRLKGNGAAYAPAYSYFSHPLLIVYQPSDFDGYLDMLLKADRVAAASTSTQVDPAAPMSTAVDVDKVDLEVLKWVLRHRCQLHALALAREISSLRGENATVQIAAGVVRTEYTYLIDVTFQVTIELQLAQPHVQAWLRQRPDMSQILFDALYYLSREWLQGKHQVVRSGAIDPFLSYLVGRMNLGDLRPEGSGEFEITAEVIEQTLSSDDRTFFTAVLEDMMRLLGPACSVVDVTDRWAQLPPAVAGSRTEPVPSVLQCLLLGKFSLLRSETPDSVLPTDWRYWPSGVDRLASVSAPAGAPLASAPTQQPGVVLAADPVAPVAAAAAVTSANEAAAQAAATAALMADRESAYFAIDRIKAIEENLWHGFLMRSSDAAPPDGEVFELLGDRARLLPTTPAWSRVKSAIGNIEQMRLRPNGGGNPSTLVEDVRAIEGFLRMLDECAPTIARALVASAFLGAARLTSDWAHVTPLGMSTLSAGLGFAGRDVPSIDRALQALAADIVAQGVQSFSATWNGVSGVALHDEQLRHCAQDAHEAGSSFAQPALVGARATGAWRMLEGRLDAFVERREELAAGLDELLCSVGFVGPSRVIGLDLKAVTLEQWTTCFMKAASVEKAAFEADEIPPWLIGYALNRLGGPALQSQELEGLVNWAIGNRTLPTRLHDQIHEVASRLSPNEIEPDQSQRVAICVTSGSDAPMVWWAKPPRRGVAFVIGPQDLHMVMNGPAMALQSAPIVAVAQGRGIRLLERDIRAALAGYPVAKLIWVYRHRMTLMVEPSLVDPASADDVLDQVIAPSSKK